MVRPSSSHYAPVGGHASPAVGRRPSPFSSRRVHPALLVLFLVAAALFLVPHYSLSDTVDGSTAEQNAQASTPTRWGRIGELVGALGVLRDAQPAAVAPKPRWPECPRRRQLSREDHKHRVAFLFMVHTAETLEGARQTVETLWDEDDLFVVHADKKMNETVVQQYRQSMTVCGNVEFVSDDDRVDVKWGKFVRWPCSPRPCLPCAELTILSPCHPAQSEVEAEIALVKHALRSDVPWSKTVLLDGTSWPRLNAKKRQTWLSLWDSALENNGTGPAPVPVCTPECGRPVNKRGWGVTCGDCRRGPARCADDECKTLDLTPGGAHVRKDHQWFLLTRDMAEYAVAGPDFDEWAAYFTRVHASSEHYFVTLQYAQYPTLGKLPPPVYVDWARPCKTHPSTNGAHPCELGIRDLDSIRRGDGLFARKIRMNETALKTALINGEEAAVDLSRPLDSAAFLD